MDGGAVQQGVAATEKTIGFANQYPLAFALVIMAMLLVGVVWWLGRRLDTNNEKLSLLTTALEVQGSILREAGLKTMGESIAVLLDRKTGDRKDKAA